MSKFIEIPNLPNSKVSLAVVDGRIPKDIEDFLFKKEIELIKTEKISCLYSAISYHPDIIMCHIGNNNIVVAKNIPNNIVYNLEKHGFNVIEGKNEVKGKYPLDVFYNVCIDKELVICNEKCVDEVLLDSLISLNKKVINVKQGYSKCSTLIVNSGIFVTSDLGIHNILIRENKKSLLISPGYIDLFDMNYGFIGGASGKVSDTEVAFYGNLFSHIEGDKINDYLIKNNQKSVCLGENKLIDLGTLIPVKEYNGI